MSRGFRTSHRPRELVMADLLECLNGMEGAAMQLTTSHTSGMKFMALKNYVQRLRDHCLMGIKHSGMLS